MDSTLHADRLTFADHKYVRWAVVIAAVAALAAAGGYLVGINRSGVTTHTGMAHSTQYQVSIRDEDGWYYSVPLDVNWTDATGTVHEGDRPSCLPPTGEVGPVSFAATQVTVNGSELRPVVWVFCHN